MNSPKYKSLKNEFICDEVEPDTFPSTSTNSIHIYSIPIFPLSFFPVNRISINPHFSVRFCVCVFRFLLFPDRNNKNFIAFLLRSDLVNEFGAGAVVWVDVLATSTCHTTHIRHAKTHSNTSHTTNNNVRRAAIRSLLSTIVATINPHPTLATRTSH